MGGLIAYLTAISTGALLLLSSPILVPATIGTAEVAYSTCLANPTTCTLLFGGAIQGLLKGGWNMETGQPTLDLRVLIPFLGMETFLNELTD